MDDKKKIKEKLNKYIINSLGVCAFATIMLGFFKNGSTTFANWAIATIMLIHVIIIVVCKFKLHKLK